MSGFGILFVCIGNVCRSPVGERLLAARLPEDRFTVSSAGMRALVGYSMSEHAAAELVGYGGDPAGFAARQISQEIVEGSDLVLTATRSLRSDLLAEVPTALRRTFTVLEFAALLEQAEGETPADLVRWAAAHRSCTSCSLAAVRMVNHPTLHFHTPP